MNRTHVRKLAVLLALLLPVGVALTACEGEYQFKVSIAHTSDRGPGYCQLKNLSGTSGWVQTTAYNAVYVTDGTIWNGTVIADTSLPNDGRWRYTPSVWTYGATGWKTTTGIWAGETYNTWLIRAGAYDVDVSTGSRVVDANQNLLKETRPTNAAFCTAT